MKLVQGVIKAPFLHTKGADEGAPSSSSSCSLSLAHMLSDLNHYIRAPVSLIKPSRASVILAKTAKTVKGQTGEEKKDNLDDEGDVLKGTTKSGRSKQTECSIVMYSTFHLFEKTVVRNYYYLQAQRDWQEVRDVSL